MGSTSAPTMIMAMTRTNIFWFFCFFFYLSSNKYFLLSYHSFLNGSYGHFPAYIKMNQHSQYLLQLLKQVGSV